MFALVDCNNFFVSCERVFRPDLWNKPVVVLSNNDGCAVARSDEVKKLGIKMGQPIFEVRDLVEKYNIQIFSANFSLYANLSMRVMQVLKQFSPRVEIYSIDEAFLDLQGFENLDELGKTIRQRVWQWVGIPVSVGIASTKTLAKAANGIAKKYSEYEGSLVMTSQNQNQILEMVDVSDVWGIGRQLTKVLNRRGIYSALDLKKTDLHWIQKQLSVMGERTVRELNGQSCIPLSEVTAPKKEIAYTRSFGRPVQDLFLLKQAIATFASQAAEKLRGQGSVAWQVAVFIHTNRYHVQDHQYANFSVKFLPTPTAYAPILIQSAIDVLIQIYKPGYLYKKAGVILKGINSQSAIQMNLFTREATSVNARKIMETVDSLNTHFGSKTIYWGSMSPQYCPWKMKQEHKSPNYTSSWDELAIIT